MLLFQLLGEWNMELNPFCGKLRKLSSQKLAKGLSL